MMTVSDGAPLETRVRKEMTVDEQLRELRGVMRVLIQHEGSGALDTVRTLYPEFFMEERG